MKIDPKLWLGDCSMNPLWCKLVALYAVDIRVNNINLGTMRAQTIREYLESLNELFEERGYINPDTRVYPVDFSNKTLPSTIFYENVKTWEKEPNRRTHLTAEFLSALRKRADSDPSSLGLEAAMLDFVILGRLTGFRLGEFGQKTQKNIDQHELPNGELITKALCRRDFTFKDNRGKTITDPVANHGRVYSVKITWRVQKNRRNGQSITWVQDKTNPSLCPVAAALRIYERSIKLHLDWNDPMGAYLKSNKAGTKRTRVFITGPKVSELFKSVAMEVYPDITPDELKRFSAHAIRVTAAVILQIAGKEKDFIQSRLRWASEAYQMYLRDTTILACRHIEASNKCNVYEVSQENLDVDNVDDTPQLTEAEAGIYED
jgi:hypothetical protein